MPPSVPNRQAGSPDPESAAESSGSDSYSRNGVQNFVFTGLSAWGFERGKANRTARAGCPHLVSPFECPLLPEMSFGIGCFVLVVCLSATSAAERGR